MPKRLGLHFPETPSFSLPDDLVPCAKRGGGEIITKFITKSKLLPIIAQRILKQTAIFNLLIF